MKIGTIASHSALNIISGARAEGFDTQLFCHSDRIPFYNSFGLEESIVEIESFDQIFDMDLSDVILIPHGSFVAYLGPERIIKSNLRLFGNKELLKWEADRGLKSKLMKNADFNVPREYATVEEINSPVIAKTHGAAGGEGYFIAKDANEVREKMETWSQLCIDNLNMIS